MLREAFQLHQAGVAAQVLVGIQTESAVSDHAELEVVEGELEGIVVLTKVHNDLRAEIVEIAKADEIGAASGADGSGACDLGVADDDRIVVRTEKCRRLSRVNAQGEVKLPTSNLHEIVAGTATNERLSANFDLVEDKRIAAFAEVSTEIAADDQVEQLHGVVLLGSGDAQRTANHRVLDGKDVKPLAGLDREIAVKLERRGRGPQQDGVILVAGVNEEMVVSDDVLDQHTIVAGTGVDENWGVEDDQSAAGRDLQDVVAATEVNADFADATGDDGDGAEMAIDARGKIARSNQQAERIGLNDLDTVAFIVADNIEHAVIDIDHDIAGGDTAGFERFQTQVCGKRLRHRCRFSCCSVSADFTGRWPIGYRRWPPRRVPGSPFPMTSRCDSDPGESENRPDADPCCTPRHPHPGDGIDDIRSKNGVKCKSEKICVNRQRFTIFRN